MGFIRWLNEQRYKNSTVKAEKFTIKSENAISKKQKDKFRLDATKCKAKAKVYLSRLNSKEVKNYNVKNSFNDNFQNKQTAQINNDFNLKKTNKN